MISTKDRSRSLAEELTGLEYEHLSAEDIDQTYKLLLDYTGVAFGGCNLPWAIALRGWAARFDKTGKAGILGSDMRVGAHVAALVNGATAHGYELDDTHDASTSHPGGVVISAAFAAAAQSAASGKELLAAIVAGYEAMARIGIAANAPEGMEAGFHPTAILGGFGAATAAAKLYRLDVDAMLTAWGHVLSLTGGSMQFSDEPAGTMVKRCHAGYAAMNGVLGAELAAAGISAPQRALDGKYGYIRLYGRHADPKRLERDLERPLEIHRISLKPYSCCRLFHSLIDGLGEVTDGYTIDPATIRTIHVRGPRAIPDQHMIRRPRSPMAAQYSLPFVVGATLVAGPTRFDAYREERLDDPAILAIADKVEASADEEIERHFPEHFGTAVDITLADGSTRTSTVLDSIGTPARPMSLDDVKAKALGLVALVVRSFDIDAVYDAIVAIEKDGRGRLEDLVMTNRREAA